MCLIIVKEEGQSLASKAMLSKVWEKNPHGAGIIYKKNDTSKYKMIKGMMTLKDLMRVIDELNLTDKDFIAYHLRWATSGDVDQKTTHPFVVHDDAKYVNALSVEEGEKSMFVMHNGVIHDLNDKQAKESDTQRFIMEYISQLSVRNIFHCQVTKALIEKFIDGSRLLITHPMHGRIKYGDWHEHEGFSISKPYSQATPFKAKPYQRSAFSNSFSQFSFWDDEKLIDTRVSEIEPVTSAMVGSEEWCDWCGQNTQSEYNSVWGGYICQFCNDTNRFTQ
jgi:hypothetical protein